VASLLGSNSSCELPFGMAENPLHPPPTLSNPHECAFIRMNPHSSASTRYHHSHSMTEVSRPAHGALFLLVRLKAIQLLLATILAITTTTTNTDEKMAMPTA
jgi:hypothetical protein